MVGGDAGGAGRYGAVSDRMTADLSTRADITLELQGSSNFAVIVRT